MDPLHVLSTAREAMSQRTVFGEPVTHDGVTIVPVAKVSGGAGGGPDKSGTEQRGRGAGFGMRAAPVGVFVIKNGEVSWRPSLDLNRAILGGQIAWIVTLLTIRSIIKIAYRRRA